MSEFTHTHLKCMAVDCSHDLEFTNGLAWVCSQGSGIVLTVRAEATKPLEA